MANTERRQEPYWAWACQTCKRQLRDSTSQCCGDYGKTIYLVPEDLHRLALGMAADDAERFTPQQYIEMAQRKLDLLGAQA